MDARNWLAQSRHPINRQVIRMSATALVSVLGEMEDVIGTGEEPDGLCGNRDDHRPHLHDSPTLGRFWCTADQNRREPYRSERRRRDVRTDV